MIDYLLFVFVFFIGFCVGNYRNKTKTVFISDGWTAIEIEKPPITGNLLVTDGEVVGEICFLRHFNQHGQLSFSYSSRVVTHWRLYPGVPNAR